MFRHLKTLYQYGTKAHIRNTIKANSHELKLQKLHKLIRSCSKQILMMLAVLLTNTLLIIVSHSVFYKEQAKVDVSSFAPYFYGVIAFVMLYVLFHIIVNTARFRLANHLLSEVENGVLL